MSGYANKIDIEVREERKCKKAEKNLTAYVVETDVYL